MMILLGTLELCTHELLYLIVMGSFITVNEYWYSAKLVTFTQPSNFYSLTENRKTCIKFSQKHLPTYDYFYYFLVLNKGI